jgi:hypothetical protein
MNDWNNFFKRYHKILLLLCIIIFIILSSIHLNDKFLADEVDFIEAGDAFAKTGRPVYYQNELNPANNGTWHPPLYVGMLGFTFYSADIGEVQARALTMIFTAMTILFVFLISLELFRKRENKYTIALMGSYIFALNPLTIQGGLLIDIDTGVLLFAMTAFLWIFLKIKDRIKLLNLLLLGLLFALLIWIKFGTPPTLLFGIFLFYALNRKFKKAVLIPIVIALVSIAVFYLSWWLVANARDLPFLMPFTHNSGTLSTMGFSSFEISYVLFVLIGRLKIITFWLTPFLMGLILLAVWKQWRHFRHAKQLEDLDLLAIISIIIFIEYTLIVSIAYYFPKYYVPLLPFVSILAAYYICQHSFFPRVSDGRTGNPHKKSVTDMKNKNKKIITEQNNRQKNISNNNSLYIYLFLIVIGFILMVFMLGDPNLSRNNLRETIWAAGVYIGIFIVIMLLLKISWKFLLKTNIPWRNVIVTSMVLGLATNCIYIDLVQVNADYSVRYYYGERGIDDVVDYIKSNTNGSSIIIAPKDVAFYTELRYYDSFGEWIDDPAVMNATIDEQQIAFLILRYEDAYGLDSLSSETKTLIENKFDKVEKEGFYDFAVFERKW